MSLPIVSQHSSASHPTFPTFPAFPAFLAFSCFLRIRYSLEKKSCLFSPYCLSFLFMSFRPAFPFKAFLCVLSSLPVLQNIPDLMPALGFICLCLALLTLRTRMLFLSFLYFRSFVCKCTVYVSSFLPVLLFPVFIPHMTMVSVLSFLLCYLFSLSCSSIPVLSSFLWQSFLTFLGYLSAYPSGLF